jgi:outer membrane protein assembly factor BamD
MTGTAKFWCIASISAALLLASASCADTKGVQRNYAENAKDNYDKGEAAFKAKAWQEAIDYFNQVRNKFPYSKYAVVSELRAADALYEDEKYIEAVEAYKMFLRMHPSNEKAPHAMFRAGMCYYKQMPKDWFFMPPTYEEDQTQVKAALEAMQQFLSRYPDSPDAKSAAEAAGKCRTRLAKHEMYVAEYYLKRERWKAAEARIRGLMEIYPGMGLDDEAMLILAKSLLGQGRRDEARDVLTRLEAEFPDSGNAKKARSMINKL